MQLVASISALGVLGVTSFAFAEDASPNLQTPLPSHRQTRFMDGLRSARTSAIHPRSHDEPTSTMVIVVEEEVVVSESPKSSAAGYTLLEPPKSSAATYTLMEPPKSSAASYTVREPPKSSAATYTLMEPPKSSAASYTPWEPPMWEPPEMEQPDFKPTSSCMMELPPSWTGAGDYQPTSPCKEVIPSFSSAVTSTYHTEYEAKETSTSIPPILYWLFPSLMSNKGSENAAEIEERTDNYMSWVPDSTPAPQPPQKDPEADNDDFELHATVSVKVDATVHKGDIDVTVHKGDVDEWNGIEAREIAEVNARDSPFSTMNEEQKQAYSDAIEAKASTYFGNLESALSFQTKYGGDPEPTDEVYSSLKYNIEPQATLPPHLKWSWDNGPEKVWSDFQEVASENAEWVVENTLLEDHTYTTQTMTDRTTFAEGTEPSVVTSVVTSVLTTVVTNEYTQPGTTKIIISEMVGSQTKEAPKEEPTRTATATDVVTMTYTMLPHGDGARVGMDVFAMGVTLVTILVAIAIL